MQPFLLATIVESWGVDSQASLFYSLYHTFLVCRQRGRLPTDHVLLQEKLGQTIEGPPDERYATCETTKHGKSHTRSVVLSTPFQSNQRALAVRGSQRNPLATVQFLCPARTLRALRPFLATEVKLLQIGTHVAPTVRPYDPNDLHLVSGRQDP